MDYFYPAEKIKKGPRRGHWRGRSFGLGSTRSGRGRGGDSFIPIYHQSNVSCNFQNDQWRNNQASDGNCTGKRGALGSFAQLDRVTDQLDLPPQHEHNAGNENQKQRSGNPLNISNLYGFTVLIQFKRIVAKCVDRKSSN